MIRNIATPKCSARLKKFAALCLSVLAVALSSGCAFGVTRVRVVNDPLEIVAPQREGTVLVRPFADTREQDHRYIGTKRNTYGLPLGHVGVADGTPVGQMVTEFFVEALKQAGYRAIIERPDSPAPTGDIHVNAILEGEVRKFWLDQYVTVRHHVDVHLRLLDNSGNQLLWENDVRGDKSNVQWLGTKSESEKVIQQAITEALNRAAIEFASDNFYDKVHPAGEGPAPAGR